MPLEAPSQTGPYWAISPHIATAPKVREDRTPIVFWNFWGPHSSYRDRLSLMGDQ